MTLPVDGFLTRLREITERAGVLLIFDEIISYRVKPGGAQELYGVRPDLTCMGKVVAGGTPGSVFGGRADVMSQYDPTTGDPGIPQSGTYNANPLAMVAGLTTLRLLTPEAYGKLDAVTQRLGSELEVSLRMQTCKRRSPPSDRSSACTSFPSGPVTTGRPPARTPRSIAGSSSRFLRGGSTGRREGTCRSQWRTFTSTS